MRRLLFIMLGMLLISAQLLAQNRTISGKVTDDSGQPISGASVIIANSRTGTSTDAKGNFTISVPGNAKALVISAIGFASQEVSIGADNIVSVSLKQDASTMEQVVVTGYSRERKSKFTGSATTLSSKVVETVPVGAFDQALQGRVSGMLVNSSTGQPGASASIHIRGISSITAAFADPLYVIDGVPLRSSDVATINPNDFESITVLKDAAASALYGARGGLGVIVITTKRGKAGQPQLTYRTQFGFTQRPQASQFDQMNSSEMLGYEEFVGTFNSGLTAPGWVYSKKNPNYNVLQTGYTSLAQQQARYDFILDSLRKNNVDYYDLLFRQGTSQTHEINLSGGNNASRYFFSAGYFNQDGTDRKSYLKRYTTRFNLDNTVGKLSIQFNSALGYSVTNYNEGAFYAGSGTANPFAMVWRAKPYENPYRTDGSLIFGTSSALSPKALGNLIERSNNSSWKDKQIKANAGLVLSYKLLPSLTLKNTVGADATTDDGEGAINANSYVGSLQTYNSGYLNESQVRRLQLINTTAAIYSNRFDKHEVEVGAYFEAIRAWTNGFGMTLYNLDPRLNGTGQNAGTLPASGTNPVTQNGNTARSGYGIRSYFGTARYTYNNKYTVTGNIRRDGTSRIFLAENKEITTWAAGVTWDAIKESFIQNQRVLTDLKLRATYGVVPNIGSIPSSTYSIGSNFFSVPQYLGAQIPQFGSASYAGSSLSGLAPTVANPNLKIETIDKLNIGVDLGFWKNRVRATVDVYKNLTKNLFVSQSLTAESGFGGSSLSVNAGKMSNKGIEADVSVDIVRTSNIDVTFRDNHSVNINKIESLGSVNEYPAGTGIIKVGLPYGTHYSQWYLGADPQTGKPMYKTQDGKVTNDINQAGLFHEFGTWMPKHVGGFSADFRYKRISLSAFFSYQFDVRRYNNIQNWVTQGDVTYTGAVTQSKRLLTQQWQKPGDVKLFQSPAYSRQFTSIDIADAKFLRFRNLNIAYNIPEINVGKTRLIKSARFYVQGQNLYIWSPWSGLDPEDDNNISLAEFPNPRAIVVGMDINF
jgi:TonB-linked SusC/RagA family outer membrane protein